MTKSEKGNYDTQSTKPPEGKGILGENLMSTPDEIFAVYLNHYMGEFPEQEEGIVLILDVRLQLIAHKRMYLGTVNCALFRPAEVLRYALQQAQAYRVVLIHTHPSGVCTPTHEDMELTRRMKKAGEILDVELLDHLIIASDGSTYRSFKQLTLF